MEVRNHKSFLLRILSCLCLPAALLLGLGSGSCQATGEVFLASSLSGFFPPSIPCAGPGGPYFTSPLVFPPYFGGEVSVRPMYLTMTKGRITNAQGILNNPLYPVVSGDLLQDFRMNPSIVDVETMFRVQLSRLSLRAYIGLKFSDFSGSTLAFPFSEFEYFKYRVGADFDLICWGRSRAGVDVDLSADQPLFTVFDPRAPQLPVIFVPGFGNVSPGVPPYKVYGNNAFTVGAHVVYNPPLFVWDWSWIFEARMRWPARQDTQLTEYDFAAGLKSPETTRGTVAFRGGYRRTLLEFQTGPTSFSGAWSGWFGEMVYYY